MNRIGKAIPVGSQCHVTLSEKALVTVSDFRYSCVTAILVAFGKESDVSTLVSILRAVHCRSTHHFFAIDALDRIDTPNGRRLASVLLANYEEYLNGAKAPDAKFKDFQNHVIHVSDNNWGGAPKACETWLARVIEDMHHSNWKAAAYSIGVLSHYFTDPFMPLHTAQHPAEAVVHRPLEWSVCKAYDWIFRRCTNQVSFPLEVGPGWISKAVLVGAAIGHKHYLPLIEFYNLRMGVKDPPAGLDARSRAILTEIFDYALTGWARVLDRIAALAFVEIPICPLTFTTVMAAVDVPAAWVVSRFTDAVEQRAVKAIFDEYQATGQVVKNLPPEIRAIASIKPLPEALHLAQFAPKLHEVTVEKLVLEHPEPIVFTARVKEESDADQTETVASATPVIAELPETRVMPEPAMPSMRCAARVDLDSDIVDAPSIGPKTATRFYPLGINTIGQFLAASPTELAGLLNVGWLDERVLTDWQDQTRLVVQVPALCGYKAQLLVGIDCRTAGELASVDLEQLHSAIRQFCATDAGARIIRSAAVPSREEVGKWVQSASKPTPIQNAA